MGISVGIDFGTSKTLVTSINPDTGLPAAIRLGRGRDEIPTTVYLCDDGTLLFGEDADDNAQFDFSSYARGFKLALGTSTPLLMGGGKTYLARQLTEAFLKHLKDRCEREALMQPIDSAVITVPAIFSPAQREDLLEAAKSAGFSHAELLPEPVAAGMAFCKLSPKDAFVGDILVVDWGGGTLDLAIVSRDNEGHFKTVHGLVDGDEGIGGEALDEEMWKLVGQELAMSGVDLDSEPIERRGVHLAAIRQGKEMLSARDENRITILTTRGPKGVPASRKKFNAAIMHHVERGFAKAADVIKAARMQGHDPIYALLVGGTCKVPLIQESLSTATKLDCRQWQYSKEAVALGAAIAGMPASGTLQASQVDAERGDDKSCSGPESSPLKAYVEIAETARYLSAVEVREPLDTEEKATAFIDANHVNCFLDLVVENESFGTMRAPRLSIKNRETGASHFLQLQDITGDKIERFNSLGLGYVLSAGDEITLECPEKEGALVRVLVTEQDMLRTWLFNQASPQPVPVFVTWRRGTWSGVVLVVANISDQAIKGVSLSTSAGDTNAYDIEAGAAIEIGLLELTGGRNLRAGDTFLVKAPRFREVAGFVVDEEGRGQSERGWVKVAKIAGAIGLGAAGISLGG